MEQTTEYQEVKGNRNVKSTLFPKIFADKKEPDEKILLLSEAFEKEHVRQYVDGCLECEVRMLNINYGHNKELMEKCQRLKEYAIFIAKIREYAKKFPDRLDIAITRAIDDCIATDILKDFLIERKSEVLEMVLYSFDKELYEEDLKQTAYEEGEQNKIISLVQKKLAKGKSVEEIAEELEDSVKAIQEIIDKFL